MRVLMTTDTVGGVWTFTRELAAGLLQNGWPVSLVSLGRLPTSEQNEWVARTKAEWGPLFQFTPTAFPLEWMDDNANAYADAQSLIEALAKDWSAEVIHSNQFCFGAIHYHAPVVITAHSDVLSWADACRGGVLPPSDWLNHYLRLVSSGLDAAAAVVAPTRWMLHALKTHFTIPRSRHVIPNGRCIAPPTSNSRILQAVTAGRLWDEAKNIELLADLEIPIPLVVAGDNRNPRGAAARLPGSVQHLQALREDDLLTLFRSSAMYICTSRYEPFGLAPLEAALCGCAVLANDIKPLREVWSDGALFFHDASSLKQLITSLAYDPAFLEVAQKRSMQRAAIYSAEALTRRYLNLLTAIACGTPEVCCVA